MSKLFLHWVARASGNKGHIAFSEWSIIHVLYKTHSPNRLTSLSMTILSQLKALLIWLVPSISTPRHVNMRPMKAEATMSQLLIIKSECCFISKVV